MFWAKIRAKRAVDCPFGSSFPSKNPFANFICLSNRWGQGPFFNIRYVFLCAFFGVLEPNGQWKLSLPVWLSFQLEESMGGKSSKIPFLTWKSVKIPFLQDVPYILPRFWFSPDLSLYLYRNSRHSIRGHLMTELNSAVIAQLLHHYSWFE